MGIPEWTEVSFCIGCSGGLCEYSGARCWGKVLRTPRGAWHVMISDTSGKDVAYHYLYINIKRIKRFSGRCCDLPGSGPPDRPDLPSSIHFQSKYTLIQAHYDSSFHHPSKSKASACQWIGNPPQVRVTKLVSRPLGLSQVTNSFKRGHD